VLGREKDRPSRGSKAYHKKLPGKPGGVGEKLWKKRLEKRGQNENVATKKKKKAGLLHQTFCDWKAEKSQRGQTVKKMEMANTIVGSQRKKARTSQKNKKKRGVGKKKREGGWGEKKKKSKMRVPIQFGGAKNGLAGVKSRKSG